MDMTRSIPYHGCVLRRPLNRLILEVVPRDPSRDAYLPDNMQGLMDGHCRRVEIGRRCRLFFR